MSACALQSRAARANAPHALTTSACRSTPRAAGKREGAQLLAGGSRHGSKGYYIEPTVFAHAEDEMLIAKEEVGGAFWEEECMFI